MVLPQRKWRVARALPLRPGLRLRPELQGGDFWWAIANELAAATGQPQFESNEFGECFKGTFGPYFTHPSRVYAYEPGMTFIVVGGAVATAGHAHVAGDTTSTANTISFKISTGDFRLRLNTTDFNWSGVDVSTPAVFIIQVDPSPSGGTRAVRLFRNGVQQGSDQTSGGATFTLNAIGKGSNASSNELDGQLNVFVAVPQTITKELIEEIGDNPARLFLESYRTSVAAAGDTTPPTITGPSGATGSTSSISVAENTTTVFTFTANESVTWDLNGGADVAKFAINSSTGALTFVSAPDFETPTDSGADNTYVVGVRATDGSTNATTQTCTVTVTDVAVPTAPTTGTTTSITTSTATINWTDNSSNETSFTVQIETPSGAGNWTNASTGASNPTAANATSLAINGLAAGTEYRPRVRSDNSEGSSSYSVGTAFTTSSTGKLFRQSLGGSLTGIGTNGPFYTNPLN